MKKYIELNLGFADATNYARRENKELLNRFFVKNNQLDELLKSNVYFLIGDKGTGKTAYSVFLANNEFKETISCVNFIYETEYVKFIELKKQKHLSLSDYTNIWKVLLLLLLSKQVKKGEDVFAQLRNWNTFNKLESAIDAFYNNAFAPEILQAFNIVEKSETALKFMSEWLEIGNKCDNSISGDYTDFQLNLLSLENIFISSLRSLRLNKNHILFIDGIDIRPRNIDYEDYLECVKGLANALWILNNDYFPKYKGSKGRLKIVLLLRPDIFSCLGLQNLNNKLRDNSILLDWKTTYPVYRMSSIFTLVNKLLSVQQDCKIDDSLSSCWDYYFSFKNKTQNDVYEDSFVSFLRFSLFRPRDILTLMKILQDNIKEDETRENTLVTLNDFNSPHIRSQYSNYLLGEIKDYLAFYHSDSDYELFLKFFEYLNGKASFTYEEYYNAYDEFANYVESNNINCPSNFETSSKFLQFLYDMDVICYIIDTEDGGDHIHWSHRERNYSNVSPKVKEGVRYAIHYGLQKAFDTGKKYIKRRVIMKIAK